MADTSQNAQALFHRKVQNRLADRYLDALELEEETQMNERLNLERNERLGLSPSMRSPKASPFSIQNILWIVASIAVFHFTQLHMVIWFDPRVNRSWLNAGVLLVGVTLAIAMFMILWLSMVKKVKSDEWEKRHPAAIPVATASFIAGSFCLMKGLWPVFGFLTPFILGSLFMGIVVAIAMLG